MNVTFSLAISAAASSFSLPAFCEIFPVCFMTAGPFISLFYKEISRKNEYYFYFNRGISKMGLIGLSLALNILIGVVLLTILSHAQPFGN